MLSNSAIAPTPGESLWRFGAFVLWERQRRLERSGELVRLGPRSFDLLLQLLKRAGDVISQQDLLAFVWSGVVVEESSVRVHMSMLRKALGKPEPQDGCREWIATVPLQGYCFVGHVQHQVAGAHGEAMPTTVGRLMVQDAFLRVSGGEHAIDLLSALIIQLLDVLPDLRTLASRLEGDRLLRSSRRACHSARKSAHGLLEADGSQTDFHLAGTSKSR